MRARGEDREIVVFHIPNTIEEDKTVNVYNPVPELTNCLPKIEFDKKDAIRDLMNKK